MLLMVKDFMKCRLWELVWIYISLGFNSYSSAFSHGGSLAACLDMKPKHIRVLPQNPKKNYVSIYTNQSLYIPGEKVPVTLRSTRDFMGFFLQARRISNDQVAGSFVLIPPGSKLLSCFEDGDTVTHSDKSLKRNLSFVWKSPNQPVGDIKFFVSVVQSYFVYWAQIESSVISTNIQNGTSVNQEIKASDMETTSVTTGPKYPNTSADTHKTSLVSFTKTKPPEISIAAVIEEIKHVFPNVTSSMKTSPQHLPSSPTSADSHVESELFLQYRGSTAHPVTLQKTKTQYPNSTYSINSRTPHLFHRRLTTPCSGCGEESKTIYRVRKLTSPRPTTQHASLALQTQLFQNQEMMKEPIKLTLKDSQILVSSSPNTQYKELKATKELSANFLHQPQSPALERNTEISTPSWVTRPVQEFGVPTNGKENNGRGMQLAMTQLGILLGCSVALGMALAAGLRCIHAQYCQKRTEVSFSEPDNNVITLRESGEMMHFKKFRENSFVLVQAEYNWITPAVTGKSQ